MESEVKTFHDTAYGIIDEIKQYSKHNPKAKLGVECHLTYVLTQFIRVVELAESTFKKNNLNDYIEQTLSGLATKNDLKKFKDAHVDETTKILMDIQQTVQNQRKTSFDDLTSEKVPSIPSYKDILQKGIKQTKIIDEQPLPAYTVLVYSDNNRATSDETKSTLTSNVRPDKLGVGIRRLRKIRNGGIAVDLNHKSEVNYFKENAEQVPGLVSRLPKKRLPLVKIASVPKTINKEDLALDIFEQNPYIFPTYTERTFVENVNIRFPLNQKNENHISWIIEVSPQIRENMIKAGKIHLLWTTCPVFDFLPITQCYRCLSFGHFAKNCSLKENVCSHCNGNYLYKDCQNKHDSPKCANCLKENRVQNCHNTMDKTCPVYLREKTKFQQRTDYVIQ
ncbi:uncharacterized protein LOC111618007 [Centruroides sculpturatus]|uniref:uncharacterized protein LOC111618007 n=1 Tax=Centruroides sculpturatus TaxID=218467 RepID=UPI000C6E6D5B|nr:uncharacterized protein LOC111618007 [Centruroides sculpturatus]